MNTQSISDNNSPDDDGTMCAEDFEKRLFDFMAEFSAGAGHELNNPLAIISAISQKRLRLERDPAVREAFAAIIAQTRRAYEMIADIRSFARPPKPEYGAINIARFFEEWTKREKKRLNASEIQIDVDYVGSRTIEIETDEAMLASVLDALSRNASDAISQNGRLSFFCNLRDQEKSASGEHSSFLEIGVENDGPCISEEEQQLMFAPFYSGRQAGRGLGFGLPKALRYTEALGMRLVCEKSRSFPSGQRWSVVY